MNATSLNKPSREDWRKRIEGEDLALALIILMAMFVLGTLVMGNYRLGPGSFMGMLISDGSKVLAAALCFILPVILTSTASTPSSIGFRRASAKSLILGVVCGVLLTLLAFSLNVMLLVISGESSEGTASSSSLLPTENTVSLLLLILFGGLLVPLAEEFLLRSLLYTYLRRWGLIIAVLVSAFIFGLLHISIIQFPLHVLSGVVLALLYERSVSLWPSVLMHATYNTLLTATSGAAILGFLTAH